MTQSFPGKEKGLFCRYQSLRTGQETHPHTDWPEEVLPPSSAFPPHIGREDLPRKAESETGHTRYHHTPCAHLRTLPARIHAPKEVPPWWKMLSSHDTGDTAPRASPAGQKNEYPPAAHVPEDTSYLLPDTTFLRVILESPYLSHSSATR